MTPSALLLVSLLVSLQVGLGYSRSHLRIVNGVSGRLGEFPYQISLQRNGAHDCGGSILNKNYVLTAAHCVSGSSPQDLEVIVGTTNLKHLYRGASKHKVTNIQVHEDYEEDNGWKNDIALIQVDPPFQFNYYVGAVKLPYAGESYNNGLDAVISGFGRTGENTPTSPILLKTQVGILSAGECQDFYGDATIRPTNICGQPESNWSTGFCSGDSGGPLSVQGKVIGIVSFSSYHGCANNARNPQVFTRVSSYIDWINNHMK